MKLGNIGNFKHYNLIWEIIRDCKVTLDPSYYSYLYHFSLPMIFIIIASFRLYASTSRWGQVHRAAFCGLLTGSLSVEEASPKCRHNGIFFNVSYQDEVDMVSEGICAIPSNIGPSHVTMTKNYRTWRNTYLLRRQGVWEHLNSLSE